MRKGRKGVVHRDIEKFEELAEAVGNWAADWREENVDHVPDIEGVKFSDEGYAENEDGTFRKNEACTGVLLPSGDSLYVWMKDSETDNSIVFEQIANNENVRIEVEFIHEKFEERIAGRLMYLAPDIRDLSQAKATPKFRQWLLGAYEIVQPLLDDGLISDYWLVFTPEVCDSKKLDGEFDRPLPRGNYLVTPFNLEELDLLEKVLKPSGKGVGKGDNTSFGVYVALLLSGDKRDPDLAKLDPEHEKRQAERIQAALECGQAFAESIDGPVRTFMPWHGRVIGEQYFRNGISKTKGFLLADGLVKEVLGKKEKDRNVSRYIVRAGVGQYIGNHPYFYTLSLAQLHDKKREFNETPWAPVEYENS